MIQLNFAHKLAHVYQHLDTQHKSAVLQLVSTWKAVWSPIATLCKQVGISKLALTCKSAWPPNTSRLFSNLRLLASPFGHPSQVCVSKLAFATNCNGLRVRLAKALEYRACKLILDTIQTLRYQSLALSLLIKTISLNFVGTKSLISSLHTTDGSSISAPSSSTSFNFFRNSSSSPKVYCKSKVEKQADSLSWKSDK